MPDTYTLSESGASVDALLDLIGTDELDTTAQTLTGAVNEIFDKASEIGDLDSLTTTDKTDVVSAINEADTQADLFKICIYSYSYSISADNYITINAEDFGLTTPAGYTPVATVRASSGKGAVSLRLFNPLVTGANPAMGLRNNSSSTQTGSATLGILYARVGTVEDITP